MAARLSMLALCCAMFVLGCGGGPRKASVTPGSMPPGGSFTGVWFSPQYGEMHIQQNGATAIGRYEKEERRGRIQGRVTGDVMRFEWTERREIIQGRPMETKGHGYFRIAKDDAEDTWKIVGEWGHDANETGGGPWNAVKSKRLRPDLGGGEGSGGESSSDDDTGDEEDYDTSGTDDLGDL